MKWRDGEKKAGHGEKIARILMYASSSNILAAPREEFTPFPEFSSKLWKIYSENNKIKKKKKGKIEPLRLKQGCGMGVNLFIHLFQCVNWAKC